MRNSLTILAAILAMTLLYAALADSNPATAQTGDTPTPVPSVEQGGDAEEVLRALAEVKVSHPAYPNMDSSLNRIVEHVQTGQFNARVAAASAPVHSEESVAVTLYITEGYAQDVWDWLEDNGASPRNIGIDYIEAYVPVSLLPSASEREGVISVRAIVPPKPTQGTVVSEGVEAHGAPAWHAAGLKGQSVRVGIIDGGYEGFARLMGTELPAFVEARCYTDIGVYTSSLADCENDGVHGTAVTEAAFDIAPEAIYYITNPGTRGDLVTAVEWLILHDVDVINMSLAYDWEGPGDGTTPFTSGALRSVDTAVANGIVFVNAAGNEARSTWFGSTNKLASNDPGFNFQVFDGISDPFNCLDLVDGEELTAQLRWEDQWNGASRDLDLILWDWAASDIVEFSFNLQSGGFEHDPFEWLSYTPSVSGTYCLVVSHNSGSTPPTWLQLQSFTGQVLEYHTLSGSIGSPAESANPALLAVGAAGRNDEVDNPFDTSIIEPFSSQGPTPDGRIKPDIVGADAGQSVTQRSEHNPNGYFFGTSQASPHIAGLAALVKQNYPNYAPQQVAQYLKTHAEERGAAGADNVWGHGFARLLTSDASPPVECLQDCQLLLGIRDALVGDGGAQLNWDAGLPINDWTGVEVDSEQRVTHLILPESGLNGSIPPELGSLSNLVSLDLYSNELSGPVPTELGNLSSLTFLELGRNQLTGEIPAELGNLADLEKLSFSGNQLTGEIPAELGNLSDLRKLYLRENGLTGEIPAELAGLADLEVLALEANQLGGELPATLGNLASLTELYLNENQLTGELPEEFGSLSSLTVLDLGGNQLSGEIPAELGNLSDLTELWAWGNQLSGEIPAELGDLSRLQGLSLAGNQLSGEIPAQRRPLQFEARIPLQKPAEWRDPVGIG